VSSPNNRRNAFQRRFLLVLILGLFMMLMVSQRFGLLNRTDAAALTPGNLVIYRVGDGSAALTANATAVFLDEYTPGGTLVQSIAMPTVVNGSNKRLTASGTATSEGLMTLSTDGKYLAAPGYDAATGTTGITTSTSASVNRVIARVDSSGAVDTTTALSDAATGGNPRSAVTTNGSDLWMDGSTGGIRYATLGATTSTQLSTTVVNLRQANIFGAQLYVSDNSGTAVRVGTVGSGTPTTAGQTITSLPGFPTSGSPYGFFLADLDAGVAGLDTLYVADDTANVIQKYSLVSGTWTANGTKALTAVRGMSAVVSGSSVTLYVTNGSSLQTLTDTSGYNATITGTLASVATAPSNTAFRGVALAPVSGIVDAAPSVSGTTPANGASGVATNANITTTFSEPVNVTGSWFQISCSQSGAHTAVASGGPNTFTINPDSDFTAGDLCTVTINHLLVNDQDTNDPPDNMAADYVFSFTVGPTLSINDVSQVEGNTGTSTFTFTVSLSQPALPGGVTFNVDTADGTATTANNDYVAAHGTGATIDEGNSSTVVTVEVNGDTTPEANETFFVNISGVTGAGVADGQGKGTIVNDDGVGSSLVVISQVYGGGGNSGSTYKNDFIELYNRGATPVDLTGWSVQFTGATAAFAAVSTFDGSPLTTNLSGTIQAGHYLLIQEAAGTGGTTNLPAPDITGGIELAAGSGKVALVSNTTVLSGNCPAFAANGIVDFVGYGTADCSETSPTAVLTNTTAAIRNNNGCMDIDYNALDFTVSGGPTPRNHLTTNTCAGSGVLSASGSANPTSIEPGGSTLLAVAVSPDNSPPSTGITVTGDLTSIGGSATQQFYDDGTHGDLTIGDNVFSFFATSAANAATGAKSLPISVADAQAHTASANITMSIISPTCGVERWSVKVGTDPDAGLVDLTKATPVTMATMRGWTAPASPPLNARVGPYETTAWVINGTLIDYKQESDVDYHIVVQDGAGNTVITEIPCPCCGIGSPFQARMAAARATFDSKLTATTFFQNPNIPVRVTGVGFFDFIHGQTGVAPNGIELHAILDIAFPTQQTAPTGTGANVITTAGDVTIHFGNVFESGTTTVTPIDPSSAGFAIVGYSLVGPGFNISTSASTAPPYNICVSVPYITDPVAFKNLKLLHNQSGVLVDITTGEDSVNKLICGSSPSLSPFVVALGPTPTAANSNVSGRIVDGSGRPVAGATVRMSGTENRLTVTDSNGNYNFAEVETNGFYTIAPSRANYTFSPAQRSFSQLGLHTEAAFTAVSSSGGLNPLDTTEYFVRQQYLDFLNREPDEDGLGFWVNNIESCGADAQCREVKRIDTSAAFFLSIEFQRTGFEVYRLYRAAFGDQPNSPVPLSLSEFKADARQIGEGVIVRRAGWEQLLEENQRAFAEGFVQRARFTGAYPNSLTPEQFVDRLFANAGVTPSLTERATAIREFGPSFDTSEVAARGRALRDVAESAALVAQESNRAFVLMQYFGYLGRDPQAPPDTNFDGYNFWLGKLESFGGDYRAAEMVKAFLSSTEYRGRFQE
jgi:Bacterial Ig-like domain/Lamin Tail Domain/Carboxypeptidase regulatory-like domain/Calx-beta domain